MAVPGRSRRDLDLRDPRFARSLIWTIWTRSNAGALLAAAAVVLVAIFGAPTFLPHGYPISRVARVALAVVIPTWVLASIGGNVLVRVVVGRGLRWVGEDRAPSPDEVRLLAHAPRIAGGYVAIAWAIACPFMILIAAEFVPIHWEGGLWQAVVLVLGFGGIAASVAAYVLTESATRPVLSRILPADPAAWPRTLGLTPRLAILSIVVSGGPLLVIAFVIARYTVEQRAQAGPGLIAACVMFSIVGFLVFAVAGYAITSPIERLRKGMAEVKAGDLSTSIDTVEPGELGLLQVGFNEMVEGLRDRERMRDVFGRHVGTDVARLAMESDFGQGGQQCEATAMFVDVIGSTGLAQQKDPDAVVAILNRFFDAVVRVVGAEGGFVNKFHGDGALCIFGAPIAQDDHAARGLRAASALARELAPMGDVAAAIGLSSGSVVAGNVGAIDRYEFTVVGDPVNEASRLSDEAKLHPSHVLVSDRTINAAGDAARGWIRGEAIALRGRSQPTITYSPYD